MNVAGTYTDLAATGTAIATTSTDDANSTAQAIGFTFDYNGMPFTQFVLNTNGFIKLGATPPSAANMFLRENATANAAFAAKTVAVISNSATTVIRFQATSDYGDNDLGMDNLQLRVITATRNEALAATVALYPNPAHLSFTLNVPAGSLHAASARLLNALGQVVQTRQLNLPATGGNPTFDVSHLAAGMYSLELKTSTDLVVKRVVVE